MSDNTNIFEKIDRLEKMITPLTERLDRADAFMTRLANSIDKLIESKVEIDDRKINSYMNDCIMTMKDRINHHEDFIKREKKEIEEYYKKLEKAMEAVTKIDISQYLAENRYIGKRLFEIEKILEQFKNDGIKKKVNLSFFLDGDELIEKPKTEGMTCEDYLGELLNTLTERERTVVIHRLGLDFEEPKNYEEISALFKVSKTRVSQIYKKALRKLKHESRIKLLKKTGHKILIREALGE